MTSTLIDWKWVLARGILGLAFGIFVFMFPLATLTALALSFGIYLLLDGGFAILASWRSRKEYKYFWALALAGVVGIVAGVIAVVFPPAALFTMLVMLSAWAMVAGIIQLFAAFKFPKRLGSATLLGIGGVISILFAVAIIAWPQLGILALVGLVAYYALFFGFSQAIWSFQLRERQHPTIRMKREQAHAT